MASPLLDSPLLDCPLLGFPQQLEDASWMLSQSNLTQMLEPLKVKQTNTNNNVRESRLVGGVHYKFGESHTCCPSEQS